jgi:hypothetical protein
MSTHKANPAKKVFAISVIILIVGYICVKIKISKNPFHSSALQSAQQRRILLLYHTDHEELLKAGREIFSRGPKDPMNYRYLGPQHIEGFPVPGRIRIPKVIRKLRPHASLINRNGYIVLQMQGGQTDFGVRIYPEGFKGKRYYFTPGKRELLPGLEYFDYKYRDMPQYDKTIDYIIQKGKYPEPNQIDLSR